MITVVGSNLDLSWELQGCFVDVSLLRGIVVDDGIVLFARPFLTHCYLTKMAVMEAV